MNVRLQAGGVLYIAINSQYYHKPCTNAGAVEPRAAQEKWVEEQFEAAAKSDAKHVVVLSHIAPFMGEARAHIARPIRPADEAHERAGTNERTDLAGGRAPRPLQLGSEGSRLGAQARAKGGRAPVALRPLPRQLHGCDVRGDAGARSQMPPEWPATGVCSGAHAVN